MHIDTDALLACVRETLALHLADHDGLEFANVEVLDEDAARAGVICILIDGVAIDLALDALEV